MELFDELLKGLTKDTLPGYAQAAATLIGTVFAVWLAYRYACKQARLQAHIQVQQDLRIRRSQALQAAWQLLAYLSPNEHGHTLLRFDMTDPATKAKQWYAQWEHVNTFINSALPKVFYHEHAGLYWSNDTKSTLFECRSILYGLWLAQGYPTQGTSLIHNVKLVEQLQQAYQRLNATLRAEIEANYQKIEL